MTSPSTSPAQDNTSATNQEASSSMPSPGRLLSPMPQPLRLFLLSRLPLPAWMRSRPRLSLALGVIVAVSLVAMGIAWVVMGRSLVRPGRLGSVEWLTGETKGLLAWYNGGPVELSTWDTQGHRTTRTLLRNRTVDRDRNSGSGATLSPSVSPDGKYLYAVSPDATPLHIQRAGTGAEITVPPECAVETGGPPQSDPDPYYVIAWVVWNPVHPHQVAISYYNGLWVWNLETNKVTQISNTTRRTPIAWSPDGTTLAYIQSGWFHTWSADTPTSTKLVEMAPADTTKLNSGITGIIWCKGDILLCDGRSASDAGNRYTIDVVDVQKRTRRRAGEFASQFIYASPDGTMLAFMDLETFDKSDPYVLEIWDVATSTKLHEFTYTSASKTEIEYPQFNWSSDSRRIACAYPAQSIRDRVQSYDLKWWDARSGTLLAETRHEIPDTEIPIPWTSLRLLTTSTNLIPRWSPTLDKLALPLNHALLSTEAQTCGLFSNIQIVQAPPAAWRGSAAAAVAK